jgi:hypothetical protein
LEGCARVCIVAVLSWYVVQLAAALIRIGDFRKMKDTTLVVVAGLQNSGEVPSTNDWSQFATRLRVGGLTCSLAFESKP